MLGGNFKERGGPRASEGVEGKERYNLGGWVQAGRQENRSGGGMVGRSPQTAQLVRD